MRVDFDATGHIGFVRLEVKPGRTPSEADGNTWRKGKAEAAIEVCASVEDFVLDACFVIVFAPTGTLRPTKGQGLPRFPPITAIK